MNYSFYTVLLVLALLGTAACSNRSLNVSGIKTATGGVDGSTSVVQGQAGLQGERGLQGLQGVQ